MNLSKELTRADFSKEIIVKLVKHIDCDTAKLNALMKLVFSEDKILYSRAVWIMSYVFENNPTLLSPYLTKLVNLLSKTNDDSIKRNILRSLQSYQLPESAIGKMTELCFGFLSNRKEAIAIRVFAMTVLKNIVLRYPDLKKEFEIILQDELPYASAGFISRSKKTLKELEKLN